MAYPKVQLAKMMSSLHNLFDHADYYDIGGDHHENHGQSNGESDSVSDNSNIVIMTMMKIMSMYGTSSSSNRVTLIRQQRTYFKKPSLSH